MKKILVMLFGLIVLTGCSKYNQKGIVKDFTKKINNINGYKLSGDLSIKNNDDVYNYDIEVCYKKDDNYKVTLTNKANMHTQIILKNNEGVYVLTPSLNKSFKFQSDWPYNNSQIYLINAIVRDINSDDKRKFSVVDDNYVFMTKVNYPNNAKLEKQKIILGKDLKPKKVIVYDDDGIEVMNMNFDKVSYSPKFAKDYFDLNKLIDNNEKVVEESSNLDDVIYPLFLPSGTKLTNEEKISKKNGERVIMSYDGEKSFTLVEETTDVFNEFTVIPSSGEPYLLMDTLGVMTDNSLSWTSGGIDFYLVSDVMSQDELIEVAQSITGIVSMK